MCRRQAERGWERRRAPRAASGPSPAPGKGGPGAGLLCVIAEEIDCSPALEWTRVRRPATAPLNLKMKCWLPLCKPSSEPASGRPRHHPRGWRAIEGVGFLSCSDPGTGGPELLPSLPERSRRTLGSSTWPSPFTGSRTGLRPRKPSMSTDLLPLGTCMGGQRVPSRPPPP